MSDWMQEMRNKARDVKQRMGAGQAFLKRLELTGKRAAVKPGGALVVRLLPRWDLKDSYKFDGAKFVKNPDYKGGAIFFAAKEHWWDGDNSTRVRAWCPTTLDSNAACPVCARSDELRQSPDSTDRKEGNEIAAKEVFLFNAITKDANTKKRALTEEGLPDIRIMVAHGTVFVGITEIMFGGGEDDFARNDITNVKEGYDIKLSRPASGGDRWKVDCSPNKTPLITEEERAAWPKDWVTLLVDLPAFVKSEMKTCEEVYKLFYGHAPEEAAKPAQTQQAGAPAKPVVSKGASTAPAAAKKAAAPPPQDDFEASAPAVQEEQGQEPPWGFEL